jgi:hypothetical protein
MIVDGPTQRGVSTYAGDIIARPSFERAKQDAISFIAANRRLPNEVFFGSQTLSLPDFAATLAGERLAHEPIHVLRGNLEIERYFATDPSEPFKWPIHPEGFSAPELLELARLQGWTLKPARLR